MTPQDQLRQTAQANALSARMKGDAEFAKGMSLPLASVEKESAYYQAASWYRLALTVLDVGETAVECYDRNIAPLTDKEAYAEASNRG